MKVHNIAGSFVAIFSRCGLKFNGYKLNGGEGGVLAPAGRTKSSPPPSWALPLPHPCTPPETHTGVARLRGDGLYSLWRRLRERRS